MKTKILALTVLLFGGLIFTSCQKDDALIEGKATEQILNRDNSEEGQESVWPYYLQNSPDPFINRTTIEYRVVHPTFVELCIYQSTSKKTFVLVNEFLEKGYYEAKFEASGLPDGEYIAELKVGKKTLKKIMIKGNNEHIDFDHVDYK